ncbi:UNVERIFIED_CONTAM: Equilibrative nucleotide transporter 3 [Sesamum calycinum]|uniref:Equilibrative nucleotide transporter 3 n=1 Tax=Sesamum calycinum TaxID=2727403 RepID=A0AAW2IT16_9LAMI
MNNGDSSAASPPIRLEGKFQAIVVCFFLGLGSLVSWNSMLTIGDYYYALFPDYHPSRVLTLVYQPFALGTIAILAYNEAKIDTRKRNLFGYILFFLSTFGLLLVNRSWHVGKGGIANFIGICVFVAAFGVADAHVQGGMVGDLSFMSPEFMQSFFAGLAASGALTSGLRLITKAAFDKLDNGLRKGVILMHSPICIVFGRLPIVKYFRKKAASEGSKTVKADLAAAGVQKTESNTDDDAKHERLSNKQLLRQNIDYALNLYLIYVLTLSIFPGFLYENTVITNWALGLSNGYLTVCVLTAAPKGYKAPEQNALGNLLVMFLLAGIFSGVALDWLWIIGNGTF